MPRRAPATPASDGLAQKLALGLLFALLAGAVASISSAVVWVVQIRADVAVLKRDVGDLKDEVRYLRQRLDPVVPDGQVRRP